MPESLGRYVGAEESKVKTAFLSCYISMYDAVNRGLGYENPCVTVDEIYDFIQHLKREEGKQVPRIGKEDISFCFHPLQISGICSSRVRQSNISAYL